MENNPQQPTTLQGFKDQVAKEYSYQGASYKDWASMEKQLIYGVPESSKAQSTKDLLRRHAETWDRLSDYQLEQADKEYNWKLSRERDQLTERVSIAVAEAEKEFGEKLQQAKHAGFIEGAKEQRKLLGEYYAESPCAVARFYPVAASPYEPREKGGEDES